MQLDLDHTETNEDKYKRQFPVSHFFYVTQDSILICNRVGRKTSGIGMLDPSQRVSCQRRQHFKSTFDAETVPKDCKINCSNPNDYQ